MEQIKFIIIYPYELSIYFEPLTNYTFKIKNFVKSESLFTSASYNTKIAATRAGMLQLAEII